LKVTAREKLHILTIFPCSRTGSGYTPIYPAGQGRLKAVTVPRAAYSLIKNLLRIFTTNPTNQHPMVEASEVISIIASIKYDCDYAKL